MDGKSVLRKFIGQIRWLQIYATVITMLFGWLLLSGVSESLSQTFDQITVRRLNVVNEQGRVVITLSSADGAGFLAVNGKAKQAGCCKIAPIVFGVTPDNSGDPLIIMRGAAEQSINKYIDRDDVNKILRGVAHY